MGAQKRKFCDSFPPQKIGCTDLQVPNTVQKPVRALETCTESTVEFNKLLDRLVAEKVSLIRKTRVPSRTHIEKAWMFLKSEITRLASLFDNEIGFLSETRSLRKDKRGRFAACFEVLKHIRQAESALKCLERIDQDLLHGILNGLSTLVII
jgi:hypothetical protein